VARRDTRTIVRARYVKVMLFRAKSYGYGSNSELSQFKSLNGLLKSYVINLTRHIFKCVPRSSISKGANSSPTSG
jgi:uncharacterized FlgJ-related protein